jgi:hypothetical protein
MSFWFRGSNDGNVGAKMVRNLTILVMAAVLLFGNVRFFVVRSPPTAPAPAPARLVTEDPCAEGFGLQQLGREHLEQGRLYGAIRYFSEAKTLCPKARANTWMEEVSAHIWLANRTEVDELLAWGRGQSGLNYAQATDMVTKFLPLMEERMGQPEVLLTHAKAMKQQGNSRAYHLAIAQYTSSREFEEERRVELSMEDTNKQFVWLDDGNVLAMANRNAITLRKAPTWEKFAYLEEPSFDDEESERSDSEEVVLRASENQQELIRTHDKPPEIKWSLSSLGNPTKVPNHGERLISAQGSYYVEWDQNSGDKDGKKPEIHVWRVGQNQPWISIPNPNHDNGEAAIPERNLSQFSPNEQWLSVVWDDGKISLLDIQKRTSRVLADRVYEMDLQKDYSIKMFSPNSQYLVIPIEERWVNDDGEGSRQAITKLAVLTLQTRTWIRQEISDYFDDNLHFHPTRPWLISLNTLINLQTGTARQFQRRTQSLPNNIDENGPCFFIKQSTLYPWNDRQQGFPILTNYGLRTVLHPKTMTEIDYRLPAWLDRLNLGVQGRPNNVEDQDCGDSTYRWEPTCLSCTSECSSALQLWDPKEDRAVVRGKLYMKSSPDGYSLDAIPLTFSKTGDLLLTKKDTGITILSTKEPNNVHPISVPMREVEREPQEMIDVFPWKKTSSCSQPLSIEHVPSLLSEAANHAVSWKPILDKVWDNSPTNVNHSRTWAWRSSIKSGKTLVADIRKDRVVEFAFPLVMISAKGMLAGANDKHVQIFDLRKGSVVELPIASFLLDTKVTDIRFSEDEERLLVVENGIKVTIYHIGKKIIEHSFDIFYETNIDLSDSNNHLCFSGDEFFAAGKTRWSYFSQRDGRELFQWIPLDKTDATLLFRTTDRETFFEWRGDPTFMDSVLHCHVGHHIIPMDVCMDSFHVNNLPHWLLHRKKP